MCLKVKPGVWWDGWKWNNWYKNVYWGQNLMGTTRSKTVQRYCHQLNYQLYPDAVISYIIITPKLPSLPDCINTTDFHHFLVKKKKSSLFSCLFIHLLLLSNKHICRAHPKKSINLSWFFFFFKALTSCVFRWHYHWTIPCAWWLAHG